MTVKQLLGHFSIAPDQVIRVNDENRRRTWVSEKGCFAFEGYEDGAEAVWEYLSGLTVGTFDCNENRLLIWAE